MIFEGKEQFVRIIMQLYIFLLIYSQSIFAYLHTLKLCTFGKIPAHIKKILGL